MKEKGPHKSFTSALWPMPSADKSPMFSDDQLDDEPRCRCEKCGGDGFIEYLDGDGGDWGEDCPSEENHLIICRECHGTGEHR